MKDEWRQIEELNTTFSVDVMLLSYFSTYASTPVELNWWSWSCSLSWLKVCDSSIRDIYLSICICTCTYGLIVISFATQFNNWSLCFIKSWIQSLMRDGNMNNKYRKLWASLQNASLIFSWMKESSMFKIGWQYADQGGPTWKTQISAAFSIVGLKVVFACVQNPFSLNQMI